MITLTTGQKLRLASLTPSPRLDVDVRVVHPDIDLAVFGLDADRRLSDDRFFVFYNQPRAPEDAIVLSGEGGARRFALDLARLPATIGRLVFTATSDSRPVADLSEGEVRLSAGGEALAAFPLVGVGGPERALMLLELYRHAGEWRVGAVGQGFGGGLRALLEHFGGEALEAEEEAPPPPAPPEAAPPGTDTKVDLRKRQVAVVLKKAGIEDVKARVMVVMDASGSMRSLYRLGVVQDTLERLVPVASKLDDNESMEFWYYADSFARMGDLDEHSVAGLVGDLMPQKNPALPPAVHAIGGGNNEPPVMQDVLRQHAEAQAEDRAAGAPVLPTLVLFLTDGGISGASRKIARIVRDSSAEPLFWQFVGLGRSNYGILEQLDTLDGRVLDNSGFFAVDDIAAVGDEDLYARLLSQFAVWWRAWQALRPAAPAAASPPAPRATAGATTGATVSLRKNGHAQLAPAATLRATLEWQGQGDLDLYAFYVLRDGTVGKVYYRDPGRADAPPFLTLSGDRRGPGREEAVIHRPSELRHVLFAAYSAVENGAGAFASYRPRAVVTDGGAQRVEVPMLGRNHFSYWVALAAVDLAAPGGPVIRHVERYSRLGTERSPSLNPDGSFTMNTGPVEFKTVRAPS